jgi:putative peptidoglycan lipid II flippase
LLAQPIAVALFEHGAFGARDTAAVAAALTAICAGLPGHVLEKVFAAVSAAHDDTRTPMLTACCSLAAAIIGGLLLFPRFGFIGVAAAIAIAAWVGAALLGLVLYRRGWLHLDVQAAGRLARIVVACIAMSIIIVLAAAILFPTAAIVAGRLIAVLTLVALGVIAYGAALQILGVVRLRELVAALYR